MGACCGGSETNEELAKEVEQLKEELARKQSELDAKIQENALQLSYVSSNVEEARNSMEAMEERLEKNEEIVANPLPFPTPPERTRPIASAIKSIPTVESLETPTISEMQLTSSNLPDFKKELKKDLGSVEKETISSEIFLAQSEASEKKQAALAKDVESLRKDVRQLSEAFISALKPLGALMGSRQIEKPKKEIEIRRTVSLNDKMESKRGELLAEIHKMQSEMPKKSNSKSKKIKISKSDEKLQKNIFEKRNSILKLIRNS